MTQFFITGLPRCRTKWFAEYFSGIDGVFCYHEVLNGLRSKEDFYHAMTAPGFDFIGNSDSGLYITDFADRWPDAPVVIIDRDVNEVFESLTRYFREQGYPDPNYDFLLEQKQAVEALGGFRVAYEDINKRLPEIHDYIGIPFDDGYAGQVADENLQIPVLNTDVDSYLLWRDF